MSAINEIAQVFSQMMETAVMDEDKNFLVMLKGATIRNKKFISILPPETSRFFWPALALSARSFYTHKASRNGHFTDAGHMGLYLYTLRESMPSLDMRFDKMTQHNNFAAFEAAISSLFPLLDEVPICWRRFITDAYYWNHPKLFVQQAWIRGYYTNQKPKE